MTMEKRSNKKVRFAENLNRTVIFQTLPEQFQRVEGIVDPRRSCRQEAKMQKPKGYGVLLKGSFVDPTQECQRNIIALVQLAEQDFVRGIERHLSPRHKQERDANIEKVLKAVLEQQKANNLCGATLHEASTSLRLASTQHSGAAQVFARRFGIADEYVVKFGEDPSAAQSQINRMKSSNAKKASRQPSSKELNSSIRDIACEINARKACRQASVRALSLNIKQLALDHAPSQSNITLSIAASKNARKACRQPSTRELNTDITDPVSSYSHSPKESNASPHSEVPDKTTTTTTTSTSAAAATNVSGRRPTSRQQRVAMDCDRYLQSAIDLLDKDDQFLLGSTLDNRYEVPSPAFQVIRG